MSNDRSSEKILDFIKSSGLVEGDQLPAEVEMAKILGLSRNSIREAYARLSTRGVLLRKHGIGTFFAKPVVFNDFGQLRGFWQMIKISGYTPSLRIVSVGEVAATDDLASQIVAPGKGRLTLHEWLFCANGHPVIFMQHVLAAALRLDGVDWMAKPNVLAALAGRIDLHEAELELINTAVNATPEIAALLEVPTGTALSHGYSKVHVRPDYTPVVSRHWSNPEYFQMIQRGPITAEQFIT